MSEDESGNVDGAPCSCATGLSKECIASMHCCTCNITEYCRAGNHFTQCHTDRLCKGAEDCKCTCEASFTGKRRYPCCFTRKTKLNYDSDYDCYCDCICKLIRKEKGFEITGAVFCASIRHNCICKSDHHTYCKNSTEHVCRCDIDKKTGVKTCRKRQCEICTCEQFTYHLCTSFQHTLCICYEEDPIVCQDRRGANYTSFVGPHHKCLCIINPLQKSICIHGKPKCKYDIIPMMFFFLKKLAEQEPELVKLIFAFLGKKGRKCDISSSSLLKLTL